MTTRAKPASPRQIRTTLARFLSSSEADRQKLGGLLIRGIAQRLPAPPEKKTPVYQQPITDDQRDRARSYLMQAGTVVRAIKTLSVDDKGPLDDGHESWAAFETAVEQLAIRAGTLLDAARLTLNNTTETDSQHEDARELVLYRRRRDGLPEQPEAEAAA